ncbi:hypothetical protein [Nonomuraea sp. NPDC049141]|uniref:hypothetical protein n=1 Tax=Nonomuraea sp. NPDC049141 TaxID=3155500 RepID=UPI0034001DA0
MNGFANSSPTAALLRPGPCAGDRPTRPPSTVFPGAVWAVGNADGILDAGACGLADPAVPS